MKHVIWPTRKRALLYAVIVILFSLALGYLLGAFDLLFKTVMGNILY
jgi:preprotein translocase SecE subunit